MEAKELLSKGDLKIEFKDGNVIIVLDSSAAKFTLEMKSDYAIDKLEEILPGDQKSIAALLKGALKG